MGNLAKVTAALLALLILGTAGMAGAQGTGAAVIDHPAKSALKGATATNAKKGVSFAGGTPETHRVGIDAAARKSRLSADYDSYLKARNPSYQGFDPNSSLKPTGGHGSGGAKPGSGS